MYFLRKTLCSSFIKLLFITSLFTSLPIWADEQDFLVELIVFKHPYYPSATEEQWEKEPGNVNLQNAQTIENLPPSDIFTNIVDKLNSSNIYTVLAADVWHQPETRASQAIPIMITGGDIISEPNINSEYELNQDENLTHALQGFIRVSRQTHPRVLLDFNYRTPKSKSEIQSHQNSKNSLLVDKDDNNKFPYWLNDNTMIMEPVLENSNESNYFDTYLDDNYNLYRIQKNMSVRLDRWHHIDNPIFGILIRLSIYDPEINNTPTEESAENDFNSFVPLPSIYESND